MAAASARLCVETTWGTFKQIPIGAAASARLCVETSNTRNTQFMPNAAASARLCVETPPQYLARLTTTRSRLRAAVC